MLNTNQQTLGQYVILKKDPVELMRDLYSAATEGANWKNRRDRWQKIYAAYHGYIADKDKKYRRSNFHVHKIFPLIETEAARFVTGYFSHKPFVAVTTDNEEYLQAAQYREKIMQYYYEHCPNFYLSTMRWIKYTLLYGCGFRIPTWRIIKRKMKVTYEREIYGYKYREDKWEERVIYDGLWFDVYSPTEVFPDPFCIGGEPRYYIVEEFIPAEDLLSRAQQGSFDIDKVRKIPLNCSGQQSIEFHARQEAAGFSKPVNDPGIVRLQHYFSRERFITLANDDTIIRDRDNWFEHSQIPVIKGIKTLDPDNFYPIGSADKLMVSQKLTNLFTNIMSDQTLMHSYPIWKYTSNVDPNSLISVPDNKVPVQNITDVDIMQMPEMKNDALILRQVIDSSIEEISGYYGAQKGFSAQRNTATSDTIFAQQGDKRIQSDVMTFEMLSLLPEAKLVAANIEQFMPKEGLNLNIGEYGTGVFKKFTADQIRGEFNYRVVGITESINRMVQREQLKSLFEIAEKSMQYVRMQNGMIKQAPLHDTHYALEKLYEAFDRKDAEKFVFRPELFGMAINNDALSPAGVAAIPGTEGMQPNPITGGLGMQNNVQPIAGGQLMGQNLNPNVMQKQNMFGVAA